MLSKTVRMGDGTMTSIWKNSIAEIREESYELGEKHGIQIGKQLGEQRGMLRLVESMIKAGTINDTNHAGIPDDIYYEAKKESDNGETNLF